MARPLKQGLDYFPLNTNFFDDTKIMGISERFGWKGELITVKLLCRIYEFEGYYIKWDELSSLTFAKRVMCDPACRSLVSEVVAGLMEFGFFDKAVYDQFGILTSKGIQERWEKAVSDSRRVSQIDPRYNLTGRKTNEFLPKKKEETTVKREETTVKREETTVKREETPRKEKKRNKTKINKTPPNPPQGECDDFQEFDATDNDYPYRDVVDCWNTVFPGSPRHVNDPPIGLNALFWANIDKSRREFPDLNDFKNAFVALRDTTSFSWMIHSAVKLDNLRFLIQEFENAKKRVETENQKSCLKAKPDYSDMSIYDEAERSLLSKHPKTGQT